ncbi:tetratricopeptide repeat family protein, partial [Orientia tsutsugamushi str. Sido]
ELGQYQKAIENYDTTIRYRPDDAEAYVNKGNVLKKLEKLLEAIENF